MNQTELVVKQPKSKGETLESLLNSLKAAHSPEMVDFTVQWMAHSAIKPRKESKKQNVETEDSAPTYSVDEDY